MFGVILAKELVNIGDGMKLEESQSPIVEDVPAKVESVLKEEVLSGKLEKILSPANGQTTQTKNTIKCCKVNWGEEVLRCLHCGKHLRE